MYFLDLLSKKSVIDQDVGTVIAMWRLTRLEGEQRWRETQRERE